MKIFNCRLCKGKLSDPKLDLGSTPLANEFVKVPKLQDTFPLQVCKCEICGHYQLNESIDPSRLFRDYVFVAGTSSVNVEHFRKYAVHITELFNLKPGNKVLDIASNDGTLLRHFKNLGMVTLGIDPAVNVAKIANETGIETISEFFTEDYADQIVSKYGTFDLVTANNVFAHVPDLQNFIKGIKKVLSPNGVFSFEVSYFPDVCEKTLFDTIYHEHSSYHTLSPLLRFFVNNGLIFCDAERIDTHGGSIRVFVKHYALELCEQEAKNFIKFWECEKDIDSKVVQLNDKILDLKDKLKNRLSDLSQSGKSIAIYGVPAKATTLMFALDINEEYIDFAIDDNALKQETFTPGKHIPVYASDILKTRQPDVLLVLAWNFADSIVRNNASFKGTWITPLPNYREI
jgi:SAM-dependent methyltransferase